MIAIIAAQRAVIAPIIATTANASGVKNGKILTKTNNSGGVQGGITNGSEIIFRVAFKPTATISSTQETVDNENNPVSLEAKGRHDPCVLPRAVPMVEAMSLLVIADHWLRDKSVRVLD